MLIITKYFIFFIILATEESIDNSSQINDFQFTFCEPNPISWRVLGRPICNQNRLEIHFGIRISTFGLAEVGAKIECNEPEHLQLDLAAQNTVLTVNISKDGVSATSLATSASASPSLEPMTLWPRSFSGWEDPCTKCIWPTKTNMYPIGRSL